MEDKRMVFLTRALLFTLCEKHCENVVQLIWVDSVVTHTCTRTHTQNTHKRKTEKQDVEQHSSFTRICLVMQS